MFRFRAVSIILALIWCLGCGDGMRPHSDNPSSSAPSNTPSSSKDAVEANDDGLIDAIAARLPREPSIADLLLVAVEITRSISNPETRSWASSRLAEALAKHADADSAKAMIREALNIAKIQRDLQDQAVTLANVAVAYATLGDLEIARSTWKKALEVRSSENQSRILVDLSPQSLEIAVLLMRSGDRDEALETIRAIPAEQAVDTIREFARRAQKESAHTLAIQAIQSLENNYGALVILAEMGVMLAQTDQQKQAADIFRKIRDDVKGFEPHERTDRLLVDILTILADANRYDESRGLIQELSDPVLKVEVLSRFAGKARNTTHASQCEELLTRATAITKGMTLEQRSESLSQMVTLLAAALKFDEALEAVASIGNVRDRWEAWRRIGEMQGVAGKLADARSAFAECLRVAQQLKAPDDQAHALRLIAVSQANVGLDDASHATFQESLFAANSIESPTDRATSLMDAAQSTDRPEFKLPLLKNAAHAVMQMPARMPRAFMLVELGKMQAQAGDINGSLKTVEILAHKVEGKAAAEYKNRLLVKVAAAQAEAGELSAAVETALSVSNAGLIVDALLRIVDEMRDLAEPVANDQRGPGTSGSRK